jgi:hypothetical protein
MSCDERCTHCEYYNKAHDRCDLKKKGVLI